MESRQQSRLQNAVSSTLSVLKAIAVPATTSAVSTFAYAGVQIARQLDASPIKDNLKHYFALSASAANMGGLGFSYLDFMHTLVSTGAWNQLDAKQRLAISGLMFLAGAGTGYALQVFGVEEHIFWAAVSSASGETAVSGAKHLTTFFANRNRADVNSPGDLDSLLSEENRVTY